MAHHDYTFREYLELEAFSNVKHEFLDGEIYAMSGGTPTHAALTAAVLSHLFSQLRGSTGRVYSSDLKIRVSETGLTTYPDVSIVCGTLQTDPESDLVATNPRLLVEVLSDSTINYDRGKKLDHYRRIPSLQVVLLVWQREVRVEIHRRAADGAWSATTAASGELLRLDEVGAELSADDVYADAGAVPIASRG